MKRLTLLMIVIFICSLLLAQNSPVVENVTGTQRNDGSQIIDVYYDLADADGDELIITVQISDNDGSTFEIIPTETLLSGDIGEGITSGNGKHIIWLAGEEAISLEGNTFKYKIIADDGYVSGETVTDYDGNVYQTIQIGDQIWMTENLKVTHYRNGDPIPHVTNNIEWKNLSSGAYSYYNNNSTNGQTHGALYNYYAVDDSRNIAPEGWHVPTDEEYKQLELALGMSQQQVDQTSWRGTNEGSKLASRADLWADGNLENDPGFGESGINIIPGGYRIATSGFCEGLDLYCYLWSTSSSWGRGVHFNETRIRRYFHPMRYGFSVRCVKD